MPKNATLNPLKIRRKKAAFPTAKPDIPVPGQCEYTRKQLKRTAPQQAHDGIGIHRPVQVESLISVASHGAQRGKLSLGFDAFRDNLQLEAVRQRDDSAHEGITFQSVDIPDKRAIYLRMIDRQRPQPVASK